jgi:Bacterial transcriptional regulator
VLPSAGVANVVLARSSTASIPSRTTSEAPPDVGTGDDPEQFVILLVAIDGGVGADEGRVDRVPEQRLDRLTPGVEGVELEIDTIADGGLEDAFLHPDDRRGVGDVGEAEPQGPVGLGTGAARLLRAVHGVGSGVIVVPAGRSQQADRQTLGRVPCDHAAVAPGGNGRTDVRSGAQSVERALAVPSPQPLRFDQLPGSRVPIHTSAMGKCLLAFAPPVPGTDVEILSGLPRLARFTDRTITRRDRLAAELRETRERGWALNDEERNPGVRAVATPVLDAAGAASAAVAIQGPAMRLPDDRLPSVARQIAEVGEALGPLLAR